MAKSQAERLKKAAEKAKKRKAVKAGKRAEQLRQTRATSPRQLDLAAAPIAACTLTRAWEGNGERTLFLARRLSAGRYAACFFDLDLWCLGVVATDFELLDTELFEGFLDGGPDDLPPEPLDPADGLKLLRDAAAFGEANGFPPPEEYEEMASMFGDVAPSDKVFEFGDGGVPHYVVDDYESPARVQLTIKQLERKLGPGGFKVTRVEEGE